MQNIREFKHKFIEASHALIGIQLPKLWNLERQFWVPLWRPLEIRQNRTWKWA